VDRIEVISGPGADVMGRETPSMRDQHHHAQVQRTAGGHAEPAAEHEGRGRRKYGRQITDAVTIAPISTVQAGRRRSTGTDAKSADSWTRARRVPGEAGPRQRLVTVQGDLYTGAEHNSEGG